MNVVRPVVTVGLALVLAIGAMSFHDPSRALQLLAFNAILIAFFSASTDVVFDAYKVDALDEREMGAGTRRTDAAASLHRRQAADRGRRVHEHHAQHDVAPGRTL